MNTAAGALGISSLTLEELTLGTAPPVFQRNTVRYDAPNSHLQLELEMELVTAGMRATVRCEAQPLRRMAPLTGRMVLSDLVLHGRVLVRARARVCVCGASYPLLVIVHCS